MSKDTKDLLSSDLLQDAHLKMNPSDIVGGLTRNRVVGWYRHDTSYWSFYSPSVEATAEMYDATMTKGESLTILRTYFPNALELFERNAYK
jgi:hypothetical protein